MTTPADPFDAPTRDPYVGITNDGWLTITLALLIMSAGVSALFMLVTTGVGVAALVVDIPVDDPDAPPLWVIGLCEGAFCLIPTALYTGAAVGVFQRAKWGWVLAVIGFTLWMSGCCAPLGLVGFYALLREEGRRAFGFEASGVTPPAL